MCDILGGQADNPAETAGNHLPERLIDRGCPVEAVEANRVLVIDNAAAMQLPEIGKRDRLV